MRTVTVGTPEEGRGPCWRMSWEVPLCHPDPLLPQASTLLEPPPSRKGQTCWEAQSCPHILAKVKENPENFRKNIPYFSETFNCKI